MNGRVPGPAAAVLLGIGLALAGCRGYSTERLTDFPRARTIAVLPFENTGFRRDLELRLTQAVAYEIRSRTSLAPTTAASADLILRGRMGADEVPIVLDDQGRVVQKRLAGWLDIEVAERATGRIVRKTRVRTTEEFLPGAHGESLAGSATDEWVRRLAERVAQALDRPL